MPPPPKPGMFAGKIRIVTEVEEPDVLVPPKKTEETSAPAAAEPPKAAPEPKPESPKHAAPPSQPKPLGAGESVRFDDDEAP
jgi:hypothetical protein